MIELTEYWFFEDSNSKLQQQIETNKFGDIQLQKIYKEEELKVTQLFEYDDKRNLIKENLYGEAGELVSQTTYHYDDNRNLIEERFEAFLYQEYDNTTYYVYDKFDQYNNWIERGVYSNKDNNTITHKRKIIYY